MPSTASTVRAILGAAAATALAALGFAATTLHAEAVSGGGYDPAQQGCSKTANRNDKPKSTEKGCHNATLQFNQGTGDYRSRWHLLSINSDQLPDGQSPHAGSVGADPGQGTAYALRFDTGTGQFVLINPLGLALDLASWLAGGAQGPPPIPPQLLGAPGQPSASLDQSRARKRNAADGLTNQQVYFGADDNLDNGEHDGVNPSDYGGRDAKVANGPSDGGAAQVNTHVHGSASDPVSLLRKNVDPGDMHNPLRAADAGTGACADGICAGADTMRRKAYQGGCRSCADQSVYNDQYTTAWRSPDCSGQSTASQNRCGRNGANGNIYQPWSERGAYSTDPGVFVYEDPDPQASPLTAAFMPYPICELYAGTMGVWVCSQNVVPPPPAATAATARAPASAAAVPTGTTTGRRSTAPAPSPPHPPSPPRSAGTGAAAPPSVPPSSTPAPAAPPASPVMTVVHALPLTLR
jgi:hypothetical protein